MIRKCACFLLALVLLLPCMVQAAESTTFAAYHSDFSSGTDGWYARSSGEAVGTVQDGAYVITGRTQAWNSPGRDFDLVPGQEHHIRVQVMQSEVEAVEFILSVAKTTAGTTTYENLARGTGKQGTWVTLTCDYTPAQCDSYTLYIETNGHGTVSYAIRDVSIYQTSGRFDLSLPSLKKTWADSFDFGTAVTLSEAMNTERMDFYATQFGIFTCGNELKPDSVLDVAACRALAVEDETAVAVHFDSAKPMLDYCAAHGLKVHGHVLVWHSQTPEAFFHQGYDVSKPLVDRETMLSRLENYIQQVLTWTEEHYPGLIVSWDVVNEAVEDGSTELRESLWTQVVGQDFVNRAFAYARQYAAEGTLLFYNDYNTYYEPKLTGICRLIDSLMADGTLDGYGFQMHMDATNPTNEMIQTCIDTIASRGLLLRVSELDVGITDTSKRSLALQAQRYADVLAMVMGYEEQFIAVHTWGVSDHLSWRQEKNPLLFDTDDQPKPAFWVLIDPDYALEDYEEGVAVPGDMQSLTSAPLQRGDSFSFQAVYTAEGDLLVCVRVKDGPKSEEDAVTLFVGEQMLTISRADESVEPITGGYMCTFCVIGAAEGDAIPFDVMINNHGVLTSWNDATNVVEGRALGMLVKQAAEDFAE